MALSGVEFLVPSSEWSRAKFKHETDVGLQLGALLASAIDAMNNAPCVIADGWICWRRFHSLFATVFIYVSQVWAQMAPHADTSIKQYPYCSSQNYAIPECVRFGIFWFGRLSVRFGQIDSVHSIRLVENYERKLLLWRLVGNPGLTFLTWTYTPCDDGRWETLTHMRRTEFFRFRLCRTEPKGDFSQQHTLIHTIYVDKNFLSWMEDDHFLWSLSIHLTSGSE